MNPPKVTDEDYINFIIATPREGGLIAVYALGNIALPFNSEGMYRGFIKANGVMSVEIYR